MTNQLNDSVETAEPVETVEPASVPHGVATGRSAKTPAIAIGAMVMIIAALFVIALGLAALAYLLAS